MDVYIFLLCYNEEVLLPHTVAHYRMHIPDCYIIIYDNMSTDNSVAIAEKLGCLVIPFKTSGMDDTAQSRIKDICWKNIKKGWVICADMDEWLCITDIDLLDEYNNGTTVITTNAYNMVGTSNTITLEDINLHKLQYGERSPVMDKRICFLPEKITSAKYTVPGGHHVTFTGDIKYSKKKYIIKHMEYLGLPFYLNKKVYRHIRMKQNNDCGKNKKTNNLVLNQIKHYSSKPKYHIKRFHSVSKKAKKIEINSIKDILNIDVHNLIHLCKINICQF